MNIYMTKEQRTALIEDYICHWGDIIDTWAWDDFAVDQGLSENELRTTLNSLSNSQLYKIDQLDEDPDTIIMVHRMNNE